MDTAITQAPGAGLTRLGASLRTMQGIHLDLGCGEWKQPGFVGMDIRDLPEVDIVHDLESFPWPLPDECCRLITASHLVEHIDPAQGKFLRFMDECWRIMRPEGRLAISHPYAGSFGYFQDPTHVNPCNEATWTYFDPVSRMVDPPDGLYRIYRPLPWEVTEIHWQVEGNLEVQLRKRRVDKSYGCRHPLALAALEGE